MATMTTVARAVEMANSVPHPLVYTPLNEIEFGDIFLSVLYVAAGEMCSLPGCTKQRYVDPSNNRVHDYCGITHANQALSRGRLFIAQHEQVFVPYSVEVLSQGLALDNVLSLCALITTQVLPPECALSDC